MQMRRKARIAFVTTAMRCGGVETFLMRLGGFLCSEGFDVEVVTTMGKGEWFERLAESSLSGRDIPFSARTSFGHSITVASCLAKSAYDIVFLNHSKHAQASLGMLPRDIIRIPILHNAHEHVVGLGCANSLAWNVAVAVSPGVLRMAQDRVATRPIALIPYGVEPPAADLSSSRTAFGGPLQLIFANRIHHEQKGVLLVPDILRGLLNRGIDVSAVFFGDGPDVLALGQRLRELGLEKKALLCGQIPPREVNQQFLKSHVFLLPSFYEGLPIAVIEAMSCGCVPIASRLRGVTDFVIEEGQSGALVDVGDVKGFVDSIAALHFNRSRWSQMSEAARRRAAAVFSLKRMGSDYVGLITDALNGRYPLPGHSRSFLPSLRGILGWRDFVPEPLKPMLRPVWKFVVR
jgi:glycosyltransferase involved in cell wall biosynthesis